MLWNTKGFPKRGWEYIETYDAVEMSGDMAQCDVCGKDIRYVHILRHNDWPDDISVGCVCAASLITSYTLEELERKENRLRNKTNRFKNFMSKHWSTGVTKNGTGYYYLEYKQHVLKIYILKECYSCGYGSRYATLIKDKYFRSLDETKKFLFDLIDKS